MAMNRTPYFLKGQSPGLNQEFNIALGRLDDLQQIYGVSCPEPQAYLVQILASHLFVDPHDVVLKVCPPGGNHNANTQVLAYLDGDLAGLQGQLTGGHHDHC